MANFYVGQRVKKVRGVANVGLTGTIIGLGTYTHGANGERFPTAADLLLKADREWTNVDGISLPPSTAGHWLRDFWEPIIPEGYAITDWSACLWQPEGVAA